MAYKYDVFLSYNRKFPHGDWVNEIFFPLFKSYLEEAINREVIIFKDSQDIQTGSDWRLKIRNALVNSKMMVSIFSPSYFRSEWCMREFATIYHRQISLGFLSSHNPNGLIVPVKIFDGIHFPEYAKRLQILDCIDFNRIGSGVKQTNLYIELQGKLQTWVYDVASAINNAPDWDSNWQDENWVEIPFENLSTSKLPASISPPIL